MLWVLAPERVGYTKRAPQLAGAHLMAGGFLYSESSQRGGSPVGPPLHNAGDGCTRRGNRTENEAAQAKPRTAWACRR